MLHVQHIKSHNDVTATADQDFVENAEASNENQTIHSSLESSATKFQASCILCKKWLQYFEKAKIGRVEYKKDVAQEKVETEVVRSVDLQKVIMLPRIPASQKTFFIRRIVAFHLTFASMADVKSRSVKKIISVLWHEANGW